jgi:hypothetical protein
MKLRIHDNSIRLRMGRNEVMMLARGQSLKGRTDLLPEPLVYQVDISEQCSAPAVTFRAALLRVMLPVSLTQRWACTEQVGIEAWIPNPDPKREPIQLLVEKDFQCLHGAAHDNEDCFANPLVDAEISPSISAAAR